MRFESRSSSVRMAGSLNVFLVARRFARRLIYSPINAFDGFAMLGPVGAHPQEGRIRPKHPRLRQEKVRQYR